LDFEHNNSTTSTTKEEEEIKEHQGIGVDSMVESRLVELFESARESGKNQMQVRLESKPKGAPPPYGETHCLFLFVTKFVAKRFGLQTQISTIGGSHGRFTDRRLAELPRPNN
jgi:hypothetical protein